MIIEPTSEPPLKLGWNVGVESVEVDLEVVPGKLEWHVSHNSIDTGRVVTLNPAGSGWVDTSLFSLMDLLTLVVARVWKSDPPLGRTELPVAARGSTHSLFAEPHQREVEFGVRFASESHTIGFGWFDYENTRVAVRLLVGGKQYSLSASRLLAGLSAASSLIDSLSTFQRDTEWSEQHDQLVSAIVGSWSSSVGEIRLEEDGTFVKRSARNNLTGAWELRQVPYQVGRAAVALMRVDGESTVSVATLSSDGQLRVGSQSSKQLIYKR